jgi:DNA repair exonuclease SbcCD ATPase subunit
LETYQIQNIDELISVRALLESEIKRLEGDLKEIPKKIGKEQKAIEKAATEIKGDLGKRNKLIRAKKEATSKLDNILADLKYASVEVILKDFAVDSLESLRDLRIALERDYQNNAERVKELKAEVKKQMEELKYLKETISQLNQKEKEKKKKEERLKHVRYLRTTVGGFISEYIIQTRLFSALKDATNNYLFAFTTGRYQVQEIYSTSHVVRGGRETIGVDLTLNDLMDGFQKFRGNLSGGDKVALGLALRMAISRLMARVRPFKTEKLRAPIINCLIMDEPLASLDYMRRPSVMNSLIQDQSFRQIFLITHTQLEGIDASKVHRILVKSEGGNSNITFTPAITLNQAN